MLSSERPTMNQAMVTATSRRAEEVDAARHLGHHQHHGDGGTVKSPRRRPSCPHTTNGAGLWPTPGAKGSSRRHTASPLNAPITIPGPNTPPEPPLPMEKSVAAMRAKGRR